MAKAVAAAAMLLLFAANQAAAWKDPNCKDVVVGESNTLGVVGENKPMQQVDHTEQWRQYGQITKLNLYYSWNHGCLQGIKATYGYKAGNALIIGHEKNLYSQHLELADYEHVVKADWRQQPNKCIEFIKLYTNKGKSLAFGNKKSTALFQTVAAPIGGWLAALKGEHDIVMRDGKKVAGGLQNLVFIWAKEQCEASPTGSPTDNPAAADSPVADAVPKPPAAGDTPVSPAAGDTPASPAEMTEAPTSTTPVSGPEQPVVPGTTTDDSSTEPAAAPPAEQQQQQPPADAPAAPTAETPVSGPPDATPAVTSEVTPGVTSEVTPGVTPGVTPPGVTPAAEAQLPDIPIDINPIVNPVTPVTPDTPVAPDLPEVPIGVNPIIPPGTPGLGDTPSLVIPVTPVTPPTGVPTESYSVCPPVPNMCSEAAAEGDSAFCPVTSPFTRARCEGGCCFSSGRCKMPLCKLNGLGADVMALDFICYGKNNGPFGGLNKCRNLACKLAKPGCQSSLLGGNCIGTVVAANDNLDEMAKQYLGKPCIEVVNHPGPLLHMPLNKPGLPVPNGEYMGSLWSVCDCGASPSPVLPALPSFDLSKHLLGKMHPVFAALVAGMGDGSCQGPLCALLPQLPVLNASLPEIQIPMTLLANLTALLKPKPLPDVAPLAGLIPAIQLPEIQIRATPLTLPDLPTFEDCVANFVTIAKTLAPAIQAVLPVPLSKPDLVHLVASLLPQLRFEAPQIELAANVQNSNSNSNRFEFSDLVGLVKKALPKLPQFPAMAANFPGMPRVTVEVSRSSSQS
uniref:Jacalin-type lectin domain-containing protein n=1 Tax=Tetradesmus obliquus TaxID=3088 RepID=A0A383WFB0_TETOB